MRKLSLLAGGIAGFMLGSYAGRGPFERVQAWARQLSNRPEVQRVADQVTESAAQVSDAATGTASKAADRASKAADRAAEATAGAVSSVGDRVTGTIESVGETNDDSPSSSQNYTSHGPRPSHKPES